MQISYIPPIFVSGALIAAERRILANLSLIFFGLDTCNKALGINVNSIFA